MKTLKKLLKRFLFFLVALTIYLNIGWAIGTYFYDHVKYSKPQTLVAKIFAGPKECGSLPNKVKEERSSRIDEQVLWSVTWPLFVVTIVFIWVAWGIICIILIVLNIIKTTLWLIFAGGIAKIFHVG